MRSRQFGYRRERQVRDILAKQDYYVIRPGASQGCADLVAFKEGERPLFVQVKGTAAGPYAGFTPSERLRLAGTARLAGARAVLAWWPPHGTLRWLYPEEWPGTDRQEIAA